MFEEPTQTLKEDKLQSLKQRGRQIIMAQKTMIQAITDALAVELGKDENVLIFGVRHGNNGRYPCY